MSQVAPLERSVAIELVLAHDFDDPGTPPRDGASLEAAQSVRERYLIELTGIAAGPHDDAQPPSRNAAPPRGPLRSRGASPERRASRARPGGVMH